MHTIPYDIQSSLGDMARLYHCIETDMEDGEYKEEAKELITQHIGFLKQIAAELTQRRKVDVQSIIERQNGAEDIILPVPLPPEIDGFRQRQLMQRALQSQLIHPTETGYRINRLSGRQSAYLCKKIFMEGNKDNKPFPAMTVEKLFGLHNLSTNISKLADNRACKPRGWEAVDNSLAV